MQMSPAVVSSGFAFPEARALRGKDMSVRVDFWFVEVGGARGIM